MKRFFKTVAVITVFSVCEKFLGFLYRIFLSRTIGSEGVGLYQVALSMFALLFTVVCSGTPITVSRLMTKYKAENKPDKVQKVITAGLAFTLAVALPVAAIIFLFRSELGFLFADERCVNIFLIVLPGLVFTSLYAVLRGVFWGNKDFLPYSVIELLEEICMIAVGIILISASADVYEGAFFAGVAVLVSYIFSFSLATAVFFIRKNKLKDPRSEFKPLLYSAMPVTAMRTANSLIVSLVSVVLPMRLMAAGLSSSQAMSAYGAAVGQAIPIITVPSTLLGSFVLVLVPELSENFYKGNLKKVRSDIEKALKFTVLVSAIFVPVFFALGEEIGVIVFGNAESGRFLSVSAFITFFMGISGITTSILNSVGKENKTLIYFIISAAFMLLSVWILPTVLGIYSLTVGFVCVYGISSVLNILLINKTCKMRPKYLKFVFASAAICVPCCFLGTMLKNLLLPYLGGFFTVAAVGIIVVAFNLLLYFGFNMVSFSAAVSFIKRPKKSKLKKTV